MNPTQNSSYARSRSNKGTSAIWSVSMVLMCTAVSAAAFFGTSALLVRAHPRAIAAAPPPPVAAAPMPPAVPLPAGSQDLTNPQSDLTITHVTQGSVPLVLVEGGVAGSRRCLARHGVLDFVKDSGASAGLNGTFFANASLHGTDNLLIGPSLCGDETQVTLSPYDKKATLAGRPLVLLSTARTRIVPYDPATMDEDAAIRQLMPEMTDAFLGGVWLVHDGTAATDDDIERSGVHDANDYRRRAFFGLTTDGKPVLGATTDVTSSKKLAQALQDAGLREAILLDSGFSTSLVYGDKILVTGHTAPGIPSRPVPHALVLFGKTSLVKAKTVLSGKSV